MMVLISDCEKGRRLLRLTLVLFLNHRPMSVLTIQTTGGRIAAVYHQMNPDKLKDLESIFPEGAGLARI